MPPERPSRHPPTLRAELLKQGEEAQKTAAAAQAETLQSATRAKTLAVVLAVLAAFAAGAALRRIASGDLSVDVAPGAPERSLMSVPSRMQHSMCKLVSRVRDSSETILAPSSEVAAGSMDLASRTDRAAASLQETAASMEQVTGSVRSRADSAAVANQLVNSAALTARKGGDVVTDVVKTMEEISEGSRRIGDINGVIDGIAFQTNILALNAAVEAARAGKQGRGFAVVASEVRALAQRSASAAKEIKSLIHASMERVQRGSTLVGTAGATMSEIVASVQRVNDVIGEITAAGGEQSSGIQRIGWTR